MTVWLYICQLAKYYQLSLVVSGVYTEPTYKNEMPGESFYYEKPVKTSKKIQEHIKNSMSQAKPLGPLITCIPDDMVKEHNLPPSFLHAWIVDNCYDAAELTEICLQKTHPVPVIITHKFVTKMYDHDELKNDPKADEQQIAKLSQIDPTVANVLIDYFNAHQRSKQFQNCNYFYVRHVFFNLRSHCL